MLSVITFFLCHKDESQDIWHLHWDRCDAVHINLAENWLWISDIWKRVTWELISSIFIVVMKIILYNHDWCSVIWKWHLKLYAVQCFSKLCISIHIIIKYLSLAFFSIVRMLSLLSQGASISRCIGLLTNWQLLQNWYSDTLCRQMNICYTAMTYEYLIIRLLCL